MEAHNGIIRIYRLNVMELVTGRSFIRHTSGLEYSFLHLHPYYTYTFTVAAVTVSPGPPSEIVTVTTLETGKFLRFLYLLSRSVSTLHYFFKFQLPQVLLPTLPSSTLPPLHSPSHGNLLFWKTKTESLSNTHFFSPVSLMTLIKNSPPVIVNY